MRFLAVTDLHYSDKAFGEDGRRHALSAGKLRSALREHAAGCGFVMNLGDTADQAEGSRAQETLLEEVREALRGTGLPYYSIIGNHDTSIPKPLFYPHLDMPDRFYTFVCGAYLCVVLDACLNDPAQPLPPQEIVWDNCWLDPMQLQWLDSVLQNAERDVLIFSHVPFMLSDPGQTDPHLIRNRMEGIRRFTDSGKVRAVFSGHYHAGCTAVYGGIPYITFGAMVPGEENTHAVVDVTDDGVFVTGFGRQPSVAFPRRN